MPSTREPEAVTALYELMLCLPTVAPKGRRWGRCPFDSAFGLAQGKLKFTLSERSEPKG